MLMALLRPGLTDKNAMRDAPWLESAELRKLKRAAQSADWDTFGQIIHLTYDEWEAYRLWCFTPYDVPSEEVRRRQATKAREKARRRQDKKRREEREGLHIMRHTASRNEAILHMLAAPQPRRPPGPAVSPPPYPDLGSSWTAVPHLVELASTCRAFLRPDGRPLRNLRDAVHCTLRELAARGAVKITMQNGARGRIAFVRTANPANLEKQVERDRISDRRSVGRQMVVDRRPKLALVQ